MEDQNFRVSRWLVLTTMYLRATTLLYNVVFGFAIVLCVTQNK